MSFKEKVSFFEYIAGFDKCKTRPEIDKYIDTHTIKRDKK